MNKRTIKYFLEENPAYRTLRKKNEMIALLVEGRRMNKDLVTDILNADRYVRMVKKEHPELDGDTPKERRIVEENYEMSIGYEPRFHENQRILKQANLL